MSRTLRLTVTIAGFVFVVLATLSTDVYSSLSIIAGLLYLQILISMNPKSNGYFFGSVEAKKMGNKHHLMEQGRVMGGIYYGNNGREH